MRRRILAACMAMCMAATTVVTSPWGGGITAYAAEETKTITVSAYDYTAVDAGIPGASETGVIMEQTVEVDADTTTAQAVQKAFDKAGVTAEGVATGYVSSINGLDATAGGGYSGWYMAYDNDDYTNWGMSKITLSDGDSIRFDYTVNPDTVTDDIGHGYYGNPYVKKLTVAGQTMTMTKETTTDANWNTTSTYYINGEETKAAGTQEDPYVFEVTIPAKDIDMAVSADITMETSLNSHYAVVDGWSISKETYDITNGLDFSVSSLGGKYKSYFTIKTDIKENKTSDSYKEMLDNTITYLRNTVTEAQVGSTGGEWAVLTLARYGYEDVDWYTAYYNKVVEYVQKIGSNKLNSRKLTDNSRVIMALSAIGADPTNVGGYNLLEPLANLEDVVWQGINGPTYALIALNTGNYDIPELPDDSTATQTTRKELIKYILSKEIKEKGGWALSGSNPDPDITTMVVQALAPYYNKDADVKAAVDRGMLAISSIQRNNGGLASWGSVNSESCAQTICALADLGRDADTDADFVKYKNSVLDAMLSFYVTGGGFAHVAQNGKLTVNGMASEQAAYALVAYDRFKNGKNTLYDMSDRKKLYADSEGTKDISKANVTVEDFGLIYDGTAKEPKVTVKYGDILLTEGVDYTKEFADNINSGSEAKVTITGMGAFEGKVEKTFTIHSAQITDDDVELEGTVFVADGKAKKPVVTVTVGGTELDLNIDYTATFANNTNPGTATVTIAGKGEYTGKVVKKYTIKATHIAKTDITVAEGEYITDGTEKTPEVTVKYNGKTLKEGTEYTLVYSDNIDAGTASVTVKGLKYYTGSIAYTFEIKPIDMTGADVDIATDDIAADGTEKQPTVIVKLGDKVLEADKDFTVTYFNNVKVGTAKATVTGIGNYTGKIKKAFAIYNVDTVVKAALNAGKVELSWNKTGDGTYVVYRKAEGENDFAVLTRCDVTSYVDDTAKGGVTYEYEIRPMVGDSEGHSNVVKMAVLAIPSAKLTNTKAGISLVWDAQAGADCYVISKRAAGDDSWKAVETVTKPSYVDKAVTEKVTYEYKITASGNVGTSGAFTAKITRKTPITKLATPKVKLENTTRGVQLKWNKIAGAKQYAVYKKVGNAKSWTKIATTSSIMYYDGAIKSGVKYTYTVRATADFALSDYVGQMIYRVNNQNTVRCEALSKSVIAVKVKKDTAITGYQIQYSKGSKFVETKTLTFAGTSKTLMNIKTAGAVPKYYVRVRGYKKAEGKTYYGAWSSAVVAVMKGR